MVCELYLKKTVLKNHMTLYMYQSTSPAGYHTHTHTHTHTDTYFLRETAGTERCLNFQV